MAKENRNLVVGLDIGTSKVVALVAELGPDGTLNVLGMGNHESKGLKKAWWSTSSPPFPASSARSRKPN